MSFGIGAASRTDRRWRSRWIRRPRPPTSTSPAPTSRSRASSRRVNPERRGLRARRDRSHHLEEQPTAGDRGRARQAGRLPAGQGIRLLVDVHGGPTGAHTNGFKVGVHNGGQLWAGRGWAGAVSEPARQQQLRREVHARQHSRLGRRRLPRHHGGRRRGHQARHRRSREARGHGLELRRLHDVLDRVADDALQGGADGRRAVEHPQHVRHDRHPGLHRHVLQQLPDGEDTEALPGAIRRSPTWTA